MIHCHRVLLSFLTLGFLITASARAQTTAPVPPPLALKNASPLEASGQQTIVAFVHWYFQKLVDGPADQQSKMRDTLITEAKVGNTPASADYQTAYCEAVAADAKAALATARDIRTRLNIALVVAHVAEAAPDKALQPVVEQLLAPDQPLALQIWGGRAARALMPTLIANKSQKNVINLLLANAKASLSGPLTDEAYEALKPAAGSLGIIVDPLLDLAEARIAVLKTAYAEEPLLEHKPFTSLAQQGVWNNINPSQRQRAMQLLVNVVHWAAFRAEDLKGNVAIREQLGILINKCAQDLWVMASITGQIATDAPTKAAAADLVARADALIKGTNANLMNIDYVKIVNVSALPATMRTIKELSTVKDADPAAPTAPAGQ
jgi:hypothetical protein